ncbi:MAG: aminoacyl-tRNA hydrolase [Candidatus Colwellbacteria bacterium]|nr:aminoacyl-tRNA hydrolase [Candidatus Colwellbacteria bacterium]
MTASRYKFRLVIGLGNPGSEYENTYHNAGHLLVDSLVGRRFRNLEFKTDGSKLFQYLKNGSLVYAKSLVFMNQSGEAVLKSAKYFKVKPSEILVVHDDSDIALGKHKISFSSRSAGHKGVESIIKSLGTRDFYRLRIGIRKRAGMAGDLVLEKIAQSDKKVLNKVFSEIKIPNLET